jgi:hypothetical protein
LLLAVVASLTGAETEKLIPSAFGPHVNLSSRDFAGVPSFARDQKIVGTYYFYWYDSQSGAHLTNPGGTDALTTHPSRLEDFSYKSVRWHRRQLADMIAAGIDVVLPVFWGAPSEQAASVLLPWSYAGLGPLVEAREELVRAGQSPPRIGLFYDTSTLQHNRWRYHADLTSDYGRRWFYATVRDFFSMIPPKHWAMIDGCPIILLYSADFAARHDQSVIDFTKAEFAREFGDRVPWIAREVSWKVKADSTVAWGGALGLKNPGVASLGPGYDHSAVPGRTPLVVARRGGNFYEENWTKFLRRPSHFVMIETWNEFHEGTDIAESREYGRLFIELTRKYSDRFKQGWRPEWPQGRFTGTDAVSIGLGERNRENGVRLVDNDDGRTEVAIAGGKEGRTNRASSNPGRYLYFAIDDSFKWADMMNVRVEVEYSGATAGTLGLEFDGSDAFAPFAGAYTRDTRVVHLTGGAIWQTATFDLSGARFLNSQNRGADFRLVIEAPAIVVGRVTVHRLQ